MISLSSVCKAIGDTNLQHWLETLPSILGQWQRDHKHGNLPKWEKVLNKLNYPVPDLVELTSSVTIGTGQQLTPGQVEKLTNLLGIFQPWRKGPFSVHGIEIDTEWRSDWKWDRVKEHITSLKNRTVLDVGCGSGYHMWRMLGQGAQRVVGIDPSPLFLCQFEAIKRLAGNQHPVHLLPLGIEELPPLDAFDTVFSMGVLYHRRDPIAHLKICHDCLAPGGELVLETLVLPHSDSEVLKPPERYAQMRNVYFFPSAKALKVPSLVYCRTFTS